MVSSLRAVIIPEFCFFKDEFQLVWLDSKESWKAYLSFEELFWEPLPVEIMASPAFLRFMVGSQLMAELTASLVDSSAFSRGFYPHIVDYFWIRYLGRGSNPP